MSKSCIACFLFVGFAAVGCVTEGPEPQRPASKDHQTPVERAHASVADRIARIRYQEGRDLLANLHNLIALKELSMDPIMEALPKSDPRTRANLIYVLGFLRGPAVHATLAQHLKDEDPTVRYEAAAGLLAMGDWSTVPVLIDFMGDRDRRLRYKAFHILKDNTKQDFGYDFAAAESDRDTALGRWKSWWSTRRQEIIYGKR